LERKKQRGRDECKDIGAETEEERQQGLDSG
jgi:hypothetical protein